MFHRLIIDQLEAMMSTVMFGPVFLFNLRLQGLSIPGPGTKLLVFSMQTETSKHQYFLSQTKPYSSS